jgi:hypothetical protein
MLNSYWGPLLLIVWSPILFFLNFPAFTVWGSATASASLMLAAVVFLIAGVIWGVRKMFRRA